MPPRRLDPTTPVAAATGLPAVSLQRPAEAFGGGASAVATQQAGKTFDVFAAVAAQRQEVALQRAELDYDKLLKDGLHNPETGIMNQRGTAAVGLSQRTAQLSDTLIQQLTKDMTTEQTAAFTQRIGFKKNSSVANAANFEFNEVNRTLNEQHAARLNRTVGDIVTNSNANNIFGPGSQFLQEGVSQVGLLLEQEAARQGWSQAELEVETEKTLGTIMRGMTERMISDEDFGASPEEVEGFIKGNKRFLDQSIVGKLRNRAAGTAAKVRSNEVMVDTINRFTPMGGTHPEAKSLADAESFLRKNYKDDPLLDEYLGDTRAAWGTFAKREKDAENSTTQELIDNALSLPADDFVGRRQAIKDGFSISPTIGKKVESAIKAMTSFSDPAASRSINEAIATGASPDEVRELADNFMDAGALNTNDWAKAVQQSQGKGKEENLRIYRKNVAKLQKMIDKKVEIPKAPGAFFERDLVQEDLSNGINSYFAICNNPATTPRDAEQQFENIFLNSLEGEARQQAVKRMKELRSAPARGRVQRSLQSRRSLAPTIRISPSRQTDVKKLSDEEILKALQ